MERVAEIIREAGLPMVALADATRDPLRTMAHAAQGRRVKTIRKRVRVWGKASRFFRQAFGAVWSRSVTDVTDYTQALREAGAITAARDFVGALIFFERGGGMRVAGQMAKHPSVGQQWQLHLREKVGQQWPGIRPWALRVDGPSARTGGDG